MPVNIRAFSPNFCAYPSENREINSRNSKSPQTAQCLRKKNGPNPDSLFECVRDRAGGSRERRPDVGGLATKRHQVASGDGGALRCAYGRNGDRRRRWRSFAPFCGKTVRVSDPCHRGQSEGAQSVTEKNQNRWPSGSVALRAPLADSVTKIRSGNS